MDGVCVDGVERKTEEINPWSKWKRRRGKRINSPSKRKALQEKQTQYTQMKINTFVLWLKQEVVIQDLQGCGRRGTGRKEAGRSIPGGGNSEQLASYELNSRL